MKNELDEGKNWGKIRTNLNADYAYNDIWEQAIEVFDKRVKSKFFNPIQTIIKVEKLEGEGFSIVTIQCALIEMFAAFRVGKIYNHSKKSKYEYKESQNMFTSLLKSAEVFKDNFWQLDGSKKLIDKPFKSSEFYKNVRCGLMHEARTKNNWRINATRGLSNAQTERVFLIESDGKIKIDRNVLHYRLMQYHEDYKKELKEPKETGNELRRHFVRKLDHLFDFPADTTFEWWK